MLESNTSDILLNFTINFSPFKIPTFDLITINHRLLRNAKQSIWSLLQPKYAHKHNRSPKYFKIQLTIQTVEDLVPPPKPQ